MSKELDYIADLERENRLLGERCNQLLKDKGELTDKIADIKANCDLAIEGRDIKIMELEKENERLKGDLELWESGGCRATNLFECGVVKELKEQMEKMKRCGNCRFDYCERSSECIDKDGNRTFHCWNEDKEKYCDVGKNGKYQCWEIEK